MPKRRRPNQSARWSRVLRRFVLPIAAVVGALLQLVRIVIELR